MFDLLRLAKHGLWIFYPAALVLWGWGWASLLIASGMRYGRYDAWAPEYGALAMVAALMCHWLGERAPREPGDKPGRIMGLPSFAFLLLFVTVAIPLFMLSQGARMV